MDVKSFLLQAQNIANLNLPKEEILKYLESYKHLLCQIIAELICHAKAAREVNFHFPVQSTQNKTNKNTASYLVIRFWHVNIIRNRSNCPEVFDKRTVLKNFEKFTGKHLCHSLFFDKFAGLQIFKKKDSGTAVLV